ncbi:hypothetical protein LEP1GSC151_4320 [Leptospira interrogans serovar Grippotyphosa str. LT2186]|uniref:Uncharacterized protein n=2 Tax=Leptospira interrogans TaxID=173 RepID=M3HZ03_LEPIR|nr:hypothetical protein LEP1GSC151_4320 [Leptospira interrogans serovar Grippotyphosa str. LT2186]EMY26370.1 hypothetical protein LEP1GSC115_5584 [Leptospira interrogans serovar Australis str. 200703203]
MELEFKNLKLDELDKPAEFLALLILSFLKEGLHPIFYLRALWEPVKLRLLLNL